MDVTEARLRVLCDCTVLGTASLQAIEAARQLGFMQTAKHNLTPAELNDSVAQGELPIVFVDTLPLDGVKGEHALVVLEMDEIIITVYDPLSGERTLPLDAFAVAWATMRHLTILVRQ